MKSFRIGSETLKTSRVPSVNSFNFCPGARLPAGKAELVDPDALFAIGAGARDLVCIMSIFLKV
jgi:hypothetical protein